MGQRGWRLLCGAVCGAVLAWAGLAGAVGAEEPEADDEGVPAYSVARLIVREGSAWVRTPDTGDWDEYETNTPVTAGSRISVPEGSEAELQFHGGQFMLLEGGAEVDVRTLSEERSSFRLRSGGLRFDLPEADFSPVRVALPDRRRVAFDDPGKYWLSLNDGGDARLVVRRGAATVTAGRRDYRVTEGQEAEIGDDVRVTSYRGGHEPQEPPAPLTEEESRSGLPPAAVYELRQYGEWVSTPEYGIVWRPRVAAGWTPYFYGRWVWISPFGWTWVSYEPWGWYPYHFGWWYVDPVFGWVWCPVRTFVTVNVVVGRPVLFHRRVVFLPATVRFVREGRVIRWVPLRPGERFARPPFTRTERRLVTWNRPLEPGRVFVRHGDGPRAEWRDWHRVLAERRGAVGRPPRAGGGPHAPGPRAVERRGTAGEERRLRGRAPAQEGGRAERPVRRPRVEPPVRVRPHEVRPAVPPSRIAPGARGQDRSIVGGEHGERAGEQTGREMERVPRPGEPPGQTPRPDDRRRRQEDDPPGGRGRGRYERPAGSPPPPGSRLERSRGRLDVARPVSGAEGERPPRRLAAELRAPGPGTAGEAGGPAVGRVYLGAGPPRTRGGLLLGREVAGEREGAFEGPGGAGRRR